MSWLLLLLVWIGLSFSLDPVKVMYLDHRLREKDFEKAVKLVKNRMEEEGLKVARVLKVSDAIRSRGVKDFPHYYILFGCTSPQVSDLLVKAPALSNLLPCSVALYQGQSGALHATILNPYPFLIKYADRLSKEERAWVLSTYSKLNGLLNSLSVRPVRMTKIKPLKEDLVKETVVNLGYDDVKMLLKSSLDGVNMNVLDVMDMREKTPRFSIFLTCNLSYGEVILKRVPQFGTLAPCRVYTYEKDNGSTVIGYVNIPLLIKIYRKHLMEDQAKIFEKADEDIEKAIREVAGSN
ncbi:protein of unknown function DUF302 [Thermocrinis albus DSM 14484]|uniref:DUF302 domain-containing protein n=1 Tax=Thermocrinis albus (strain DSM 14484 / JCM 11386 / HI 11/12) TaxID=638303 RepID=D3SQF8_THEAH|nr:DUF302 domain-containing protein [Thermocrinis albus]ADC89395.1 protein of unknown function DUF302 [Thermocrinis albus DSM 14484]